MAFLTSVNQLCGFLVDFWKYVINWFYTTVGNYAWSIILLTVVIKLLMTPLDFVNKNISRKNTKMQKKLKPELEKLQKKYANDKNTYNQKVSELYKSNNYNIIGSCLFMFINLGLTLLIFISLMQGLNAMASQKIIEQYESLKEAYIEVIDDGGSVEDANAAVVLKYEEKKFSWLWIDNVWKPDSITNSIPNFDEYIKIATNVKVGGIKKKVSDLTDEERTQVKQEYETIMNPLSETSGKTNGYLILLVLIVGTSFFSQWLMLRKNKKISTPAEGADPTASTNKLMLIILPIMLGFFAFSNNAVFALYLLTSQLISIGTTPLNDFIIDKLEEKKLNKLNEKTLADYNRNRLDKTTKN